MSRTSAILDRLELQPRWALIAGGAAWTLAIGALDWTTGTRVVLSFFYMLPVALAAWAGRRTTGIITALLTAAVWYIADAAATGIWFDAVQLWNVAVRLAFLLFVVVVVSSLQQTLAEQRDLARRDVQTGLANAREFRERAEVELRRLARVGSPLTIAYCDVDNLKSVNDTLGHEAGDRLLYVVGQAMLSALRTTDTVARMGGDEFAVLLPETADGSAHAALAKMLGGVQEAVAAASLDASLSVGAVWTRFQGPGVDDLLREADTAMYQVKGAGKAGLLLAAASTAPDTTRIYRPDRASTTVRTP